LVVWTWATDWDGTVFQIGPCVATRERCGAGAGSPACRARCLTRPGGCTGLRAWLAAGVVFFVAAVA
jgi:hypothetical protein